MSVWRARAAILAIRSIVHTRAATRESTAAWYPLPVPISSTFSRPVNRSSSVIRATMNGCEMVWP